MNFESPTTSSLTSNGIERLIQGDKSGIVLQIITAEEAKCQSSKYTSTKYKAVVSDGVTNHVAILGNKAAIVFKEAGEPDDCAIEVKDALIHEQSKDNFLILITKMDIVELSSTTMTVESQEEKGPWSDKVEDIIEKYKKIPSPPSSNKLKPLSMEFSFGGGSKSPTQLATTQELGFGLGKDELFGEEQMIERRNRATYHQREKSPIAIASSKRHMEVEEFEDIDEDTENIEENKEEELKDVAIKELSPGEPFSLKARISKKGEIQKFQKEGGQGQRLTITIIDTYGEAINATFFDDSAEYYFPLLEEGKMYRMRGGNVKATPEKFRKSQGMHQIVFDKKNAKIEKVDEDEVLGNVQQIQQKKPPQNTQNKASPSKYWVAQSIFVRLAEIGEKHVSTEIDIAAFVAKFSPLKDIQVKGKPEKIRTVILGDDTDAKMTLTLWGDLAKSFKHNSEELMVIEKAKVTKFRDKIELSNSFNTRIVPNTNDMSFSPRVAQLLSWKKAKRDSFFKPHSLSQTQTQTQAPQTQSTQATVLKQGLKPGTTQRQQKRKNVSTLEKVSDEMYKITDKAFFDVEAKVVEVKIFDAQMFYPCCAVNKECQRKATKLKDGGSLWKCGTCGKIFPNPNYRYILNVKIQDGTRELLVKAFDGIGETILGMDANTFKSHLDKNSSYVMTQILPKALGKEYEMCLLVKTDTFRGAVQNNIQIVKIHNVD